MRDREKRTQPPSTYSVDQPKVAKAGDEKGGGRYHSRNGPLRRKKRLWEVGSSII